MKFKKLVVYNIDRKTTLDENTWEKIASTTEKIVFLPDESPKQQRELKDADGVLINFGTLFSKEHIDMAPQLKYIGVLATAFGKIDEKYAKKKKIIVSNLKGYSTESVAEFIVAAILEHARGLEKGKTRGKKGNYSEMGITAFELKNKVFGIIGLGTIGTRTAEIASGFGCEVRYWSRTRKKHVESNGIRYMDFDKLLATADILSINLAQTSETERIFTKIVFAKIKKGAVVVNTAPMDLINIDALAARLKQDDMTFILDHSDEMSKEDLAKISKFDNCIIYPPIAYISSEATENKKRIFVENIQAFLKGKPINVVNP